MPTLLSQSLPSYGEAERGDWQAAQDATVSYNIKNVNRSYLGSESMDQAYFFHTFCQMNLRHVILDWASCVVQLVKNPPAMQETWVQSLGWEDPLEKEKATHSRILAWRSPWTV